MAKITITVDVDGNAISREYAFDPMIGEIGWGVRVEDMLDTLEKSNKIPF